MRSLKRSPLRLLAAALAAQVWLAAQVAPATSREIAVQVPPGVPLEVVSSDFDESEFEPRGGALVIELAGSIRFRHTGPHAVRALTLAIDARHRMMGGRAAVAAPSLNAATGEEFDIGFNLRLLRPLPLPAGPVVQVSADAVLLDTLAALGPDRLDSARALRTREMEARRDREHFLSRWSAGGRNGLAAAMQDSLRRQAARPRLAIRLAGGGPATAVRPARSREIELALVDHADAPILLEGGSAIVTGLVTDAPRLTIRNRTGHGIRRFDIGWLVLDGAGNMYSAGSAPLQGSPGLAANERREVEAGGRFEMRPGGPGERPEIGGMGAYLRSAHMDDGSVWIPSRRALEESRLLEVAPVSAEEQRLAEIYRSRGPDAVLAELRRFAADGERPAPR